MSLPRLLPRSEIHKRLPIIFPEGTPHRGYCVRELAASTAFAALYVGAIEGAGIFFGPKHVYRMSDRQASRTDEKSRATFASRIMSEGRHRGIRATVPAGARRFVRQRKRQQSRC